MGLADSAWRSVADGIRERAGTVRFRYRLLASVVGYAITAWVAWFVLFHHPGWAGRDLDVWIRAGADVRAGISPYHGAPWETAFYYAPPWALLFGLTSWLGKPVLWALITLAELLALRYIAGSWLRVGYFGLCFLTGAELVSGAFNLVIAASLVAAMRGDSRFAALTALTKLSPALAIRDSRSAAKVLLVALVVTAPVIGWWADWIMQLGAAATGATHGYSELPWTIRLVLALAILGVWRSPRAGPLAAAVAIPGLYAISVVLLYAAVAPLQGRAQRTSPRFAVPAIAPATPAAQPASAS